MKVRVLDTPGFADTRGILQDEPPKESIATQIKKHTDSVTAVLILANGTVPGVTVGTNSALSAMSTIFPQHPTNNVAFVLTNVSSPLYQMFSGDTVPDALKDAPQFLLNNPVALQKRYLMLKDDPHVKRGSTYHRDGLKADKHNTLEMMVRLFHWLDSLTSHDPLAFGQLGGFGEASGLVTVGHKGSPEDRIDYPLGGGDPIFTTTGASLPRPANKQEDLSIGMDGLGSKRSNSIEAETTNELKQITNRDTSPDMEHHDEDESDPADGDDDLANHVGADPDKPDKPANNNFANKLHTMISDPEAASFIWWTELGTR